MDDRIEAMMQSLKDKLMESGKRFIGEPVTEETKQAFIDMTQEILDEYLSETVTLIITIQDE